MIHKAPQIHTKTVSANRNIAFAFDDVLDSGELLTGTPTILEVTTTDLTITNKTVSTAELTIDDIATPLGEAVQCHITGGVANTTYEVLITVTTDSTPAQTLNGKFVLKVIAD